MYLAYVPIILLSVALNAAAQLLLRQGMPGMVLVTGQGLMPMAASGIRIAFNPWVFSGLSCFAASLLLWMYVLSKVQVSFAYPFNSIGYVIVVAAAYFFFREPLSAMKLAGVGLICLGVLLVTRS
ncbi:SMR family transporter [Stenotrophomonas maltophilia]|uniref:SMR family transporter n=1 Tax=Stenotrophomonas maltophilia TaxID=40324 RepID=UPI0021C85EE6|nr:SMR family transporter [Stenotrophomonas maltophilia]MCU1065504.1 EamA family transporter [Stenotrophomonas maltophilia]MCU1075868.1 EamA family transporter [Stenotrophomonas maltophilia]MCU1140523.1 EamA family transporter [Stenotrophomonas maltophilia]